MQAAMFVTEPKTDQRSKLASAVYNSYAQLIEEIAKVLQDNHYSAHELYEILIYKSYLRPAYFKDFQKFLRWAIREGYLDKGKIVSKTIQGIRIPNRFTKEQLLTYFHTLKDPRVAVASFLGFWSGLRIGDVIKLKIEDFDFEGEVIKIVQSKRSKDRIAPFLREGQTVIEKWIKYSGATEYLFPGYGAKSMATLHTPHISTKLISDGFSKIVREASLQRVDERYAALPGRRKNFTFHTFRHTFCTYHLEHEVSPAFVARAAGHADMKTTVGVYGHMASGTMMRAFRRSFEQGRRKSIEANPKLQQKARKAEKGALAQLAEKFISGDMSEDVFLKKKQVLLDAGLS